MSTNNKTITCSSMNALLLDGSCKIMEGKFGGGFYVRYRFEKNTGTGHIELLLQYPDGIVIPVLLCKNVCKIADINSDGIGKTKPIIPDKDMKLIFEMEEKKGKILKEIIPNLEEAVSHSSFSDYREFIRYERPDFPIPIKVLWKKIIENWEHLPIATWNRDAFLDDVYGTLLAFGENKANDNPQLADKTGVYLTKSEIEDVLSDFGYDFKEIRRIFDTRNLWLKDSATAGYQFTKKIDGKNIRFYKLRKINIESKVNVTTELCVEYTEN